MTTNAIGFHSQTMAEWRQDLPSFITHLEAGFAAIKITDENTMDFKTQLTVTPEIAAYVNDLFENLPSDASFTELKKRLLARFTPTKEEQIKKLLSTSSNELGDLVPSALFRRLKIINAKTLPDDILLHIWRERLPINGQSTAVSTQQHLTAHRNDPMDDQLRLADNLQALAQQTPHVNEVSSRPDHTVKEIEELRRRIKQLEAADGKKNFLLSYKA